jgi:mono/diheme cytochrome c family protein
MKKLASLSMVSMLFCCAITSSQAQEVKANPIAAGHDFALKVCAACHVVASDQQSQPILKPPAPPFSMIVKNANISEPSLRKLLQSPHGNVGRKGKMPNPQLADYQIDEVVAYLLDLKHRQ